jgi:8-oxo-dGTP pyrophosphatase MutT (NUDIX family)
LKDDLVAAALLPASPAPLHAADAVAALLVREDGRYVVQLRDALPTIFYPGHWGCFGGAVDARETPLVALKRELAEELEFTDPMATEFTRFEFDLSRLGQPKVYRIYFEVPVSASAYDQFVLHEGVAFEAVDGRELLIRRRVTPYDAFAIWLHMSRGRFEASQSVRCGD